MHGADYDMTMLQREFDMVPPMVWDTQIGARLLGMRKFGSGRPGRALLRRAALEILAEGGLGPPAVE